MTTKVPLGTLERRSAREAWADEALGFTPWLAEHLDVLGAELGLALTLRKREHPVGRYSLDLLLEDARGRTVIVENQFGQSDHDHLGKVLTYGAGTKADLVVWIAESFTDEHAAALEWLNENSVPGKGFFAVVLELLQIGQERAPNFDIIVRPNEWAQEVRRAASAQVEWNWEKYASELRVPDQRLDVGRALVDALQEATAIRELPWQVQFNKGYVAIRRPGGYNVAIVDVFYRLAPRYSVKIPASPEELGLSNPYPSLTSRWTPGEQEWDWHVPTVDAVPDVGLAVDLIRPFHPVSGPMVRLGIAEEPNAGG